MPLPVAPGSLSHLLIFTRRLRRICFAIFLFAVAPLGYSAIAPAHHTLPMPREDTATHQMVGAEIADHNGYPELRVDGKPFFVHSAAFFYYRMPRAQWEPMLERYRTLGINTIDLYIPWNWHEPKEGEFDFDGHTNPSRDLRALLAIIGQKGLKLIARPGPEILNEWRHGGYPGWLLERPEYQMNSIDWLEGRYPPLDGLNAHDAEAAAAGWLANATHMDHTRAWFAAVAKELAPFSSHHMISSASDDPEAPPHESSGPLLFVQLGDDFAINRTNRVGHDFWRYVEDLRQMLESNGLDTPVFINPTDMRVSAEGAALDRPVGVMGQWYMPSGANLSPAGRKFDASDAGEIELYTEELKTQSHFPPLMIEYQAGWYAPGDDDGPPASPPENTLLSSRLLIANGIHGFNYFPLQDTYTPAGYSVPWVNQSYRWDAALDPNGGPQPRLEPVERNSRLLYRWGSQLAASHKRADFGIVCPLGAYPQDLLTPPDILSVSETVARLERLGMLTMLSSELLDPEHQPVERLAQDPLLLLPVPDAPKPQFQLSDHSQQELVEYVRRGGTLVIFPTRPEGQIIAELWKEAPASGEAKEGSAIRSRWKFGQGEVIESTKDFLSWMILGRSLSENRAQSEEDWSSGVLREFLAAAGLRSSVELTGNPKGAENLIANTIVTNEGTGLLGDRDAGEGFLSVTNLSQSATAEAELSALSPDAPARRTRGVYIPLHVMVPPRESLLLPLDASLCLQTAPSTQNPAISSNPPCADAVVSSSAELLRIQRDGKVLELTFYVPASSTVLLHLEKHPSHITLEGTTTPEAHWTAQSNELEVTIPRGAAPLFLRVLRIDLPYTPHVPEAEKPGKPTPNEYDVSVWNAITLPVGTNTFLRTSTPLVAIAPDQPAAILFSGVNRNTKWPRSVDVTITGTLRGGDSFSIPEEQNSVDKVSLKPTGSDVMSLTPDADGLLHSTVKLRSGRDQRTIPIAFLQSPKAGLLHYRFDFDGDGADEWVLESGRLRLIVSPESGGRAIALVDKSNGANLTTSVGLFRDAFSYTENPAGGNPLRARGRYGLFNRSYTAEWLGDAAKPGLKLREDASDIYPSGATVDKSIQFDGPDGLQVEYRVNLHASPDGPNTAPSYDSAPQSFVAMNSFPAASAPGEPTRFCWHAELQSESGKSEEVTTAVPADTSNQHCEDFSPAGKLIELPDKMQSVEIHATGRPVVEISWGCGEACPRMSIEPKNFSALFRLQFPPLTPGTEAHYSTKIRALDLP